MNPEKEESISSIGYDLLNHAKEFGDPNNLPLTTKLFPFLLLASRRMTTREMSAWLETHKGVKLSAAGISKGLSRPDVHLKRIAEFVQPLAAYIVAVYYWRNETDESLLFDKDPRTGNSVLHEVSEASLLDPSGRSAGITEAFETLWDLWDPIPEEVKFMCRPYFGFDIIEIIDNADEGSNSLSTQLP